MATATAKHDKQDGKLTPRKAASEDKPARTSVEKYVYDAVRSAGEKFAELSDEQKARALAAPDEHAGLRGKALAAWVLDGEPLGEQVKKAQTNNAAAVAEAEKARRSAAAKAAGTRPPKSEPKYPQNVRDAVKRANEIRGKSHGAGPKQHVHVREVVTAELGGAGVDKAGIVRLSGAKNIAHLFALAAAEAPREELKALHPLAEKMGDDPWCKGRHLAAALAAWTDEIEAAKKGGEAK